MNAAKPNQQKGGSRLSPELRLVSAVSLIPLGVVGCIEWTRGKVETDGFTLLVDAGLPEYTGEYLVARYADRFPADVVQLAQERLEMHGVQLPQ